jgi:hypothetical protein
VTPTPEPPLEPAPPLAQVPGSSIEQIPSAGDPTLVVDGAHSYAPGEFLTTPPGEEAPEGFLLKVVSSSTGGGKTEVLTEPASFYEAVPNGEIDEDLSESNGAVPLNAAASRIEASASGISQLFSRHISCTDGAQAELSGSLEGGLDPRLELKWHKHFGIPTGVDKARVALEADIEAEVSASVSAKGSCKLSPVTLFTPKWEVPVDVGPVVVPVKVEIPVSLIASAEVKGKVSLGAEAGVHGAIGAAYEDGGIHGVHEFSTSHDLTDSVSASAKLRVGLNPEIKIKAGWSVPVLGTLGAEVDAGITAGPELDYDTTRKPPGSYCAFLDLESSVALDLPHEDPIEDGPHTWYDGDLACVVFGPEEEGGGKPEVKGETGEKELGEREGKDGEQAFEEEREAEERKIAEEVELIEEEEELESEEGRLKRQRAELARLVGLAGETDLIKWTGVLRVSISEVEAYGATHRERHNSGEWDIDGYSFENIGAHFGSEYEEFWEGNPGTDHSEVFERQYEHFGPGSCAREGYLDEEFAYDGDAEGDSSAVGFRYTEGLPNFAPDFYLASHLRLVKQAVWGCPRGSTAVEEQHYVEEIDLQRAGEEGTGDLLQGGGCLEQDEGQTELIGPGEVFVSNSQSNVPDPSDLSRTYSCSFFAELTARCREPGKPQSAWPPPNARFECPESKH